ncbi:hypothetical protein ACFL3S_13620 [Gemmatimonadota bacterium]
MRGFRLLAATGIWAMSACYSYVPVELETVSPGENVRLTITREAAERLEPALPSNGRILQGEVVQAELGSLWVSVAVSTRQSGFQYERIAQTLRFDQGETLDIELKTLNRRRTFATVGTAAVIVSAVAWTALGGEAGGHKSLPPGDGTSDDTSRWILPLFRLPLRMP